jgi:hypothetical protein
MEEELTIRVNLGFQIGWHANQHNSDKSSSIQQLDVYKFPVQRRETEKTLRNLAGTRKNFALRSRDRQPLR